MTTPTTFVAGRSGWRACACALALACCSFPSLAQFSAQQRDALVTDQLRACPREAIAAVRFLADSRGRTQAQAIDMLLTRLNGNLDGDVERLRLQRQGLALGASARIASSPAVALTMLDLCAIDRTLAQLGGRTNNRMPSAALTLSADAGSAGYGLRGSPEYGFARVVAGGVTGNAFEIRPTFAVGGRNLGGPYVDAGNVLPASSALTISAWIYADSLASEHVIASKYDSNGPGTSWFFTVSSAGLRAGVYGEGDEVRTFETSGGGTIPPATWVHVAFTFNAATQEGRLYVNGKLQPSSPQGRTVSSIRLTTTPVRLGAYFSGGSYVGPSAFFFGLIDSARFYTSALGPQEISALVNSR